MGLISPGVENLLDILDLRQVLSSHDEDPMDTLWWPVERPVPIELLGGFSGFLSRRYQSLRPCVEFWLEPEDSSPVLTWILGYFWSLHKGAIPRLVWGHARVLSSRPVAAVSRLPSRGSRDLWLFLEAFPRGFPRGLSHVPPWCELILGMKIEAVQGKQVPLEWTEASGELLELWHDPGVPLAFPCESASHWDATGMPGILSGEAGNWSLISSYEAETGLLWMWAGPLCFLSSGVGYVGELLELQQGCEGPFRISTGQMWLASRRLSGNGPHLPWWREPSGFSRVAAGALELRRGPQRPALAASGKGSPHASCSGASRDSSPFDAGALVLVLSRAGTWGLFSCANMDLGVILESPQGSQSSSRVGACTWTFLPSCSCSVTLPVMWLKGSVAFPGGFPKRLSHRALPRATVLWVDPRHESRGSAGKTASSGMDWDIWGTLGMVAGPWSSPRLSCGERLLLRFDGNAGNSFPTKQGKDPSSRATRRKCVSSGCERDPRASSWVETCMSGI